MRLALVLLALVAASCRTADVPLDPLVGTAWTLTDLTDADTTFADVPPDGLVFDAEGRGVRLSTCNTCTGLYAVGDRTLDVSRLACTRRACAPGRVRLDRYLAGRSRWAITGDRLVLTVHDPLNGIDAVLTFRRAEG